ncbi:hypothetical protein B0T26DRAFT_408047 [Lasiosphaeria miniovina]|uniref:HECT-type E3 ubiquitin transferase n=1 Tax=Lasiosphaeria miniovina TaxID=1954250 RepID=A0AA40A562_9PEZI|nr:uncharacterized protein B0T26DRAFT_408047 [Lasiosphaeria miniovina]KAK0709499.1 hypothetical protein B0T26DRAFT_408047 [Lasiosphaeria miniovina]
MFPTFTGNSRRARNVNLSGQRTANPFTNPSWGGPSTAAAGASKSVALAQAERQQRQHERDRLKAALRIQKTWRGHCVRWSLRASRRQALDRLYDGQDAVDAQQRSVRALPLVLAVNGGVSPEDHRRLVWVAQDLLRSNFSAFVSGAVHFTRLNKLARLLIASLEGSDVATTLPQTQVLLETLNGILKIRPRSIEPVLGRYCRVLGECGRHVSPESPSRDLLRAIVVAPLIATGVPASFTSAAYHEFALSFLTQPDLVLFEADVGSFVADVDTDCLSESLLNNPPAEPKTPKSYLTILWLLAHLVALQKAKRQHTWNPKFLKALYLLLSLSSTRIRAGSRAPDSRGSRETRKPEDMFHNALPPYILNKLSSLIDKDEISSLLDMFTLSSSEFEDASFLAGYILTLIYCFPTLSDDIRMRLYLVDMSTRRGSLPALKFFWNAMSQTSIFSTIVSNEEATLNVLRQKSNSLESSAAKTDSQWHREWRTILLFLELYVFILRLTDDDDFFSGLNSQASVGSTALRLRSSTLSLEELKRLTRFLKHLSFTLYYSAAELLEAAAGPTRNLSGLDDFLASPVRRSNSVDVGRVQKVSTFVITAGIDFDAFRSLVTAAMRMLYERDSRRPFLPQGHWLMTSKFDMEGFFSAVVLEEQRQRELRESGEDDDDGGDGDEMDTDEPANLTFTVQRPSLHAQLERLRTQQRKAARERMLASIGPRLEILRNMPFIVPFEIRVQIFRQFVHLDKERRRGGFIDPDRWRLWILDQHGGGFEHPNSAATQVLGRHQAQITRGRIFLDAMNKFWELEDGLKEPIQITFVDEFGMQEAGIDGGGVTKEFLTSVTTEAFTQDQRLFVTNSQNSYYPNPSAVDQQREALRRAEVPEGSETWRESLADLLRQYEFLGRIIGKCMYEGILIDIVFAGFFLLKWATAGTDTYRANINDLRDLDDELYQGMLQLKNYPGDVSDLDLDFTITDQVSPPDMPVSTVTRNLIPDGENVPVTNENKPLYISYVARHRLAVQPHAQTRAFLRGLGTIIDPAWLSMFNQIELQRLVGGDNSEIDVEDWRRHTFYSGVYAIGDDGEEHPTVKMFWDVVRGLEDRERRDVLKYVTSTPRAPLLGFSQLSPAFSIRDGGQDQDRLPSASTCMNLLKLPQYQTAATLKSKLLYAVSSGAGFDLS